MWLMLPWWSPPAPWRGWGLGSDGLREFGGRSPWRAVHMWFRSVVMLRPSTSLCSVSVAESAAGCSGTGPFWYPLWYPLWASSKFSNVSKPTDPSNLEPADEGGGLSWR